MNMVFSIEIRKRKFIVVNPL